MTSLLWWNCLLNSSRVSSLGTALQALSVSALSLEEVIAVKRNLKSLSSVRTCIH